MAEIALLSVIAMSAAASAGTAAYSTIQSSKAAEDAARQQEDALARAEVLRNNAPGTAVGSALKAQSNGSNIFSASPLTSTSNAAGVSRKLLGL